MKKLLRPGNKFTMGVDVYWVSASSIRAILKSYDPGLRVLRDVKGSAGPIITRIHKLTDNPVVGFSFSRAPNSFVTIHMDTRKGSIARRQVVVEAAHPGAG